MQLLYYECECKTCKRVNRIFKNSGYRGIGEIVVTCQYCSTENTYKQEELRVIFSTKK